MIYDAYGAPYTASVGEQYADAAAARSAHGAVVVDGRQVADTLACVHCGGHFVMRAGSGMRRGFCSRCHGVTCGQAECNACQPVERRLDAREAFFRQHGAKP